MPSTDLIQTDPRDRPIRSYHRAFLGELYLYQLGNDLRPWRPIPARGVFWAAVLEAVSFVFAHLLRLPLPIGSAGWCLAYLVVPVGLAALFTVARVEGRRLHVMIGAWLQHAVGSRQLVGGYRRLPSRTSRLVSRGVRVTPSPTPPEAVPLRRYAAAAAPFLALVAVGAIVFANHQPPHSVRVAHAAIAKHLTMKPVLAVDRPVARRRAERRAPTARRHRTKPPPTRRRRAPKAAPRTATVPLLAARAPVITRLPVSPPSAPSSATTRPSVSPPSRAPCYPGVLGC